MPNEKAIIDYDMFVNLLINYGFDINAIVLFIDRYVELTAGKDEYPMFMINRMSKAIYNNIVPIQDISNLKNSKTKNKKNRKNKNG